MFVGTSFNELEVVILMGVGSLSCEGKVLWNMMLLGLLWPIRRGFSPLTLEWHAGQW